MNTGKRTMFGCRNTMAWLGVSTTILILTGCGGSSSSGSGSSSDATQPDAAVVGTYSGSFQRCGRYLVSTTCIDVDVIVVIGSDGTVVVDDGGTTLEGVLNSNTFNVVIERESRWNKRYVGTIGNGRITGWSEYSRYTSPLPGVIDSKSWRTSKGNFTLQKNVG